MSAYEALNGAITNSAEDTKEIVLHMLPVVLARLEGTFVATDIDDDDKSELQGNLFSRSAWRRFTLLTLDKRGFLNEDERARVEDQGLCLRQRCANFDSVAGGDMREFLDEDKPLALRTFEAQERRKRDSGAAGEGHGDPTRSEKRPRDSEEVCAVLRRSTRPRLGSKRPALQQ